MTKHSNPLRVIEETPAYWRVLFANPPLNVVDAAVLEGLRALIARMDASQSLRVVVFESALPEFYMAHFDMTGRSNEFLQTSAASGVPVTMDAFIRLTTSPVVSIAKIRGRVRGLGSEFILACDMRFASRENTLLGQPEVGAGVTPGGGGTERLPLLTGRGRALEIILGADDFDGDTAERYGYVNRSLPDDELDAFVDGLARRIASFDRRPIETAKNLVNRTTLPSVDMLLEGRSAFATTLGWPETQQRVAALFRLGMQQEGDLENRLGARLATFLDNEN